MCSDGQQPCPVVRLMKNVPLSLPLQVWGCARICTLVWDSKAAPRQGRDSIPEGRGIAFWWVVIDIINNDCDIHFRVTVTAEAVLHPDSQGDVRMKPQWKRIPVNSPGHLQLSSCCQRAARSQTFTVGGATNGHGVCARGQGSSTDW